MKEETKLKLKKAVKVAGLVGGFLATFILGMGFGSCSEKKVQDQSSQRQSQGKALAPKYALNPNDNLLNRGQRYDDYVFCAFTYGARVDPSYNNWVTYVLDESVLLEGQTYVLTFEGEENHYLYPVCGIANAIKQRLDNENSASIDPSLYSVVSPIYSPRYISPFVFTIPSGFYHYVIEGQGSSYIGQVAITFNRDITGLYLADSDYFLNNAEGVDMTFGDNWLPYGMFTQWASGNLGIAINNFGDAQTTQNTLLRAIFSDLLFTCGDGFGYDAIEIVARPLWNGAKYINSSGEVITYSWSANYEYVPLVINYVNYRRFDNQLWVRAADYSLRINSDGTAIAINPQLTWQSAVYKSPRFFRYPSGFVYPSWTYSDDVGAHWYNWQPSRPQAGLTFFDWFSLRAEDIAIGNIIGNDGTNVFTLISSGFTAVLPIFNVQVLPFLTIGTLLFAPLVILLIFAILKVLNK